ncbi:hypothetical protein [Duganella sp. Root198D2]|uniref:hypothetical protein n=1 Tax=Duganella sp. Root198D2 TaxID=1736489 RepID=UPI00070A4E79|nr:hypothetical protein [Duganella sp. Root198D2]
MSELKPYAEPIMANQLKQGEIYVMVSYVDSDMLVPELRTLIFLGRDVTNKSDDLLYFQDIGSYVDLGAFPKNLGGQSELYHCRDNQLKNIFVIEKAIDELRRCSVRRQGRQSDEYDFLR